MQGWDDAVLATAAILGAALPRNRARPVMIWTLLPSVNRSH